MQVVHFDVTSGGGSVTGATRITDSQGIAAVGSWRLGPSAGNNTLVATLPGRTGMSTTFTASAALLPVIGADRLSVNFNAIVPGTAPNPASIVITKASSETAR